MSCLFFVFKHRLENGAFLEKWLYAYNGYCFVV